MTSLRVIKGDPEAWWAHSSFFSLHQLLNNTSWRWQLGGITMSCQVNFIHIPQNSNFFKRALQSRQYTLKTWWGFSEAERKVEEGGQGEYFQSLVNVSLFVFGVWTSIIKRIYHKETAWVGHLRLKIIQKTQMHQGLMKIKSPLCSPYLLSVTAFPDVTYLNYNNCSLAGAATEHRAENWASENGHYLLNSVWFGGHFTGSPQDGWR